MVTVTSRTGESFNGMLKRFSKELQNERVLKYVRRKRFYEKPSAERKRKAARKLSKSRKTTRKMQERGR